MGNYRKIVPEFKVNDYLTLRLENGISKIYINGKLFIQCKFLLLSIPTDRVRDFDDIESIDEAAERLDSSMEGRGLTKYTLSPETEFWGHCSNLQAWYENDYNTRIINRYLAFPLLKALVRAGDPLAKKVIRKEITSRLESGFPSVVSYLLNQDYLRYLKRKEINAILDNPKFMKNISEYIINVSTIPQWLHKKISRKRGRVIVKPVYDAKYKIIVLGDPRLKTQLIQRFLTNLYKSDSKMTIGVDFVTKSLEVDDKKVKLQIWDFGGEERFRFLLPTYVRGANGALFIYDVTNHSSLEHIDDWLMIMRKELRAEDQFPIIVVGIVSELDNNREISSEEGINIARSRGVDGFIECSPITGDNVQETFEAITRLIFANSGLA